MTVVSVGVRGFADGVQPKKAETEAGPSTYTTPGLLPTPGTMPPPGMPPMPTTTASGMAPMPHMMHGHMGPPMGMTPMRIHFLIVIFMILCSGSFQEL